MLKSARLYTNIENGFGKNEGRAHKMTNPIKHEEVVRFNVVDVLCEIIFIIGIISINAGVQGIYKNSMTENFINKFVSYVVLIIVFIGINIYNLIKRIDLLKLKEANKNLLEVNDKVRCFKHDFNNIMQSIYGYIVLEDMESLQTYFNSLVKDCNYVNIADSLNNKIMENPAISAILLSKYRLAENNNIEMNVEILVDLSKFKRKAYMISRMLGILLDNAIEASKETEEKIINVQFIKDDNKNVVLIKIENTYINKEIDLGKIFEKDFTTKPGNSGLGLWKLNDILKQDTEFDLFTTKDDFMFKQQLEIYG